MFKSFLLATPAVLALSAPALAAPLTGAEFTASQANNHFTFDPESFVVGPGIDITAEEFSNDIFSFDFDEDGVLAVSLSTEYDESSYHGAAPLVFTDVTGSIAPITGFSLLTSEYAGITQDDLGFSDNQLTFDFNDVPFSSGDIFTAQISVAEPNVIPLPATLPLLGAGLGLLALRRRRA